MGHLPTIQRQVANGFLEKVTALAIMWFEIVFFFGFAYFEHFLIMKNFTGPIIGLYFIRNNSVFHDIDHTLLHFVHLSMQAKMIVDEVKTTKPKAVMI